METEAKGWSVPTCSQEEPWRRVGEEMQRGQWDSLPSLSPLRLRLKACLSSEGRQGPRLV
jgi:hypothetical protein